MKTQKGASEWIRPRWAAWLSRSLRQRDIRPVELARALAGYNTKDTEIPRSLVQKWLNSKCTALAATAYDVGETLTHLEHPYSSGLLAVVAAGYFREFIRTLRYLATTLEGRKLAGLIVQYMPIAAEGDLSEEWGTASKLTPNHTASVDFARLTLAALSKAAHTRDLIEHAWKSRDSRHLRYQFPQLKTSSRLIDFAMAIAQQPNLPMHFLWPEVARYLDLWRRIPANLMHDTGFSYNFLDRGDEVLGDLIYANRTHSIREEHYE